MATLKQQAVKRLKMSERAEQQLALHFPTIEPLWLWRRKANAGFTTLPRTLPLAMQAIDAQSKGQPAGHTLFCLWARSPDHPLVTIENPATFAAEAGFFGERAVDTWRRRMKKLRELFFITTQPGPSGDFHYVLLLNPNVAVEYMYSQNLVQPGLYARFIDRVNDIGAHGDIAAIRALWEAQRQAAASAPKPTPSTEGLVVPTLRAPDGQPAPIAQPALVPPAPTTTGK
jgi:hypothetical protein